MRDLNGLPPLLFNTIKIDNSNAKVQTVTGYGKPKGVNKDPSRLKEVCRELESLFIGHLLKEMRATVNKSGFLSGGRAEELYTSMLDGQLAKELSAKGGIGLVKLLLDDLESKPTE